MIKHFSSDFLKILRRVAKEVSSARDLRASLDLMVEQIKDAMNTGVIQAYVEGQIRNFGLGGALRIHK